MSAAVTRARERPLLMSGPMVRAILDGRKTVTRRALTPQPEHLQAYDWRGRRLHDSEYRHWCWRGHVGADNWDDITEQLGHACPFGAPGDRLWVRETWTADFGDTFSDHPDAWWHQMPRSLRTQKAVEWIYYAADESVYHPPEDPGDDEMYGSDVRRSTWEPTEADLEGRRWVPSIHMPRWASRLLLEVTDVRVERLQDISYAGVIAEGLHEWLTDEQQTDAAHRAEARKAFAELWDGLNARRGFPWASSPWVWVVSFRRCE